MSAGSGKRKQALFDITRYIAEHALWDAAYSSIAIRGERPELHNFYLTYDSYDTRYLADLWLDP